MDRLRAALEEVAEIVKAAVSGEPRTRVEEILDEHLAVEDSLFSFSPKVTQASTIPTFVMNDLASRTNNIVDYPFIQSRIWEVLIDYQHDPQLMKKALGLLHFILINGSIQVLKDCQDPPRSSFLRELADEYNRDESEQYRFSTNLDVGAGVRKLAAEINNLLFDERALFYARRQAEKLHQSLSDRGLRGACSSLKERDLARSDWSFRDEIRPLAYSDSRTNSSWGADDLASRLITHVSFPLAGTPREMRERYESQADARSGTNSDEVTAVPDNDDVNTPLVAFEPNADTAMDLLGIDMIELPADSGRMEDRRGSAAPMRKFVATI